MQIKVKRSAFRVLVGKKDAKLRLFCFPHAGAGVAPYLPWAKLFSADIEVVGIVLPGRETRMSEPPLYGVDDIVSMLAPEIGEFLGSPFAFFGHSMGALIAFELACNSRRLALPEPAHLFLSGRGAPNWPVKKYHELPTAGLVDYLRSYHGTANEILESQEMLSILLPMLKADLSVCASGVSRSEPPLHCPITAFAGDKDKTATAEMISDWRRQTTGPFQMNVFPGTHFFVLNSPGDVARMVEQQLQLIIRDAAERPQY